MRRGRRRILKALCGVLIAAAVLSFALFHYIGRSGSSTVESWVGGQLQWIAGLYLKPSVQFADLDYEYPGTVRLKDFRLVAADPAHPGQTVDVLAAGSATLELADVPVVGKPIAIRKVILDRPTIRAVVTEPNSGKFIGFDDLLRDPTTQPTQDKQSPPKLSDVFQMRLVELSDGTVLYDPRVPSTPPMQIEHIHTKLDVQPDATGLYKLSTSIRKEPVFDLTVAGRLNLDTFTADELLVTLAADVGREKDTYFPPEIQELLRKYEVRGKLGVKLTGLVPALDYKRGKLQLQVALTDANVSAGDYVVPVKSMALAARLDEGKLLLDSLLVKSLGGEASVSGSLAMNDSNDGTIDATITGVVLDEIFKGRNPNQPHLSGKIDAKLSGAAPALDLKRGKLEFSTRLSGVSASVGSLSVPVDAVSLSAKIAGEKLLLDALTITALGGQATVSGSVAINTTFDTALRIDLKDLSLANVAKLLRPNEEPLCTGTLTATLTASGSPLKPRDGQAELTTSLADGGIRSGTNRIPIDALDLQSKYADRQVHLDRLLVRSLQGEALVAGTLTVDSKFDTSLRVDVKNLSLVNVLRALKPDEEPAVVGLLNATLTANGPALQPRDAKGELTASLAGAQFLAGPYLVPVERIDLQTKYAKGRINFDRLHVAALQGDLDARGGVTTNAGLDGNFKLEVTDMRLEELHARPGVADPMNLVGSVTADVRAAAPFRVVASRVLGRDELARFLGEMPEPVRDGPLSDWGTGVVTVDHGKLIDLPLLNELRDTILSGKALLGHKAPPPGPPSETAKVTFDLVGDAVRLNTIAYDGETVVARGDGKTLLDGRLDLTIRGEPVGLGALGTLSGRAAVYHVVGTVGDPKIEVQVAGATVDKAKEGIGDGVHHIKEGIKGLFEH